ncbi:MAG: hypothetical protein HY074_03430 [Deltaproteobacteria bacterium]|nr:hypothetical protein [Deltaproteobacteria bacterium]
MRRLAWFCMAVTTAGTTSCTTPSHHLDAKPGALAQEAKIDPVIDRRLVRIGLELLNPGSPKHDADKGRAYLEYALKHGALKQVEMPAPVLLELLRSEKVASERSRALEEQLEIMKAIDLNREEAL